MAIVSAGLKYANAVNSLRPGCQFIAKDSGITRWDSPDLEQPSESDIQAEIVKLQAEYDNLEYSRTRANEYFPIGDQLDMQYKDLINGTTTWKDHVAKVKSDNPKG